jgi:hypothetical protein
MNVEQIPWFGKLKICSFDLESSKTTVQEGDNGKISRFASDQEVLGYDGTGEISRFASDPRGLRHEDIGDSSRFASDQVDPHEDIPHAPMRPSSKIEDEMTGYEYLREQKECRGLCITQRGLDYPYHSRRTLKWAKRPDDKFQYLRFIARIGHCS